LLNLSLSLPKGVDHGIPVFIQKLHMDNRTATVFPLNEMNREQIVKLDGLTDEGP